MADFAALVQLIKDECVKRNLDYRLMCAIIDTESSFNIYAIRYEPKITKTFQVESCARLNRIDVQTEAMAQRFSWGLGQVLGTTLRWLGFRGLLSSICDPDLGIFWCCEAFQKLGKPYHSMQEQIAAYNAGSVHRNSDGKIINQKYVDRVLAFYKSGKYE